MAKKKKKAEAQTQARNAENQNVETELQLVNGDSNEKKREKKKREKENAATTTRPKEIPTVSIAVPGYIIDNAQSLELATRLAGQIARAATIFRIDEVVVFDNKSISVDNSNVMTVDNSNENESGAAFLICILRYLETPQYLRKSLVPKHNSLRFVGLLPPLDVPHHLRKHEWAPYWEGVTLKEQALNSVGTLVVVGLSKNILIDQVLEPGTRVTVATGNNRHLDTDLPLQVVSSSKPREEARMYWGYKVRDASNISSVFKDCLYKGGYDHLIGTSEHGLFVSLQNLLYLLSGCQSRPLFFVNSDWIMALPPMEMKLVQFVHLTPIDCFWWICRHLLIAFGGLSGLEESIEEDNNFKGKNVHEVFDSYLNTCPHQGSRTIRTEEAIFISLQYFQDPISCVMLRFEHDSQST